MPYIPSLMPEYSYSLSNDILNAHDTELAAEANTAYAKKKTITIVRQEPKKTIIRTYFEIATTISGTTYGKIYKNDVAYGTERSTTLTSYVSFSEDLIFEKVNQVQLWTYGAATGHKLKNFRILGILSVGAFSNS